MVEKSSRSSRAVVALAADKDRPTPRGKHPVDVWMCTHMLCIAQRRRKSQISQLFSLKNRVSGLQKTLPSCAWKINLVTCGVSKRIIANMRTETNFTCELFLSASRFPTVLFDSLSSHWWQPVVTHRSIFWWTCKLKIKTQITAVQIIHSL